METKLTSAKKQVVIKTEGPTVLIGERINPTGKKKLSRALQKGDLELVRREAIDQVMAGADVLDVNVGALGVDEEVLLPEVVKVVMDAVDVPLCLDSTNPAALEKALKVYQGKPLVNSVTGQEGSLDRILPLVKKHRAAVIGLTMDDEGIPDDVDKRVAIAHKIVKRAEKMGIPREDVIIDCLTLSVGANERAGMVVIESIRRVKEELGVNLTIGASNISFGLPDRSIINNAFISVAICMGVTCPIVDVAKVRPAVLATDLLLGRDRYAIRYIKAYQQRQKREKMK
ncbi:pterin-binding protein [Candidatus Aerophobetes bacterium]|uniref:Pterin-binding protein n=1 Tax=Aerophobetes bacterium TaxID=2030807 RepID=A0A497E6N6_UNCAE|nr:MAG: pterin-binding protein [Candidatus Aerophobetes bacterium]